MRETRRQTAARTGDAGKMEERTGRQTYLFVGSYSIGRRLEQPRESDSSDRTKSEREICGSISS